MCVWDIKREGEEERDGEEGREIGGEETQKLSHLEINKREVYDDVEQIPTGEYNMEKL